MKKRRGVRILLFLVAWVVSVTTGVAPLWADAISLKDGAKVMGVIVEETADRVVISTIDGEKSILKQEIQSVVYDDPEQSYYQLGKDLQRVGRLREALEAYRKAAQIRPDFQAANEAVFNAERLLWLEEQTGMEAEVERQKLLLEQAGQDSAAASVTQPPTGRPFQMFEEKFGCEIAYEEGRVTVKTVAAGGPASQSGLRVKDMLAAVWSDPIEQLPLEMVMERLNSSAKEMELSVERSVILPGSPQNQINLELGYDGLRIADLNQRVSDAGFLVGDLVVSIDGNPTRYMPLSKAQQLVSKSGGAIIVVQRDITLRTK
ncbi:MAG: hypothetical protein NC910_00590 [Candidatus Omnitrophica bacterium]|nr:hypothetical protein [Candidatus Omnitrophota bacterium]